MVVRLAAAVVTILLGVLFAWTVYATFAGPEQLVTPTAGVIDRGPQDRLPTGPQAADALRDRAKLQTWREAGANFPGTGDKADVSGSLIGEDASAAPVGRDQVRQWMTPSQPVSEILRERGYVKGVVNLPEERGRVLQQPGGRTWRAWHNDAVTYGGGWVIFGFSLLLAVFLLMRGRVPLHKGFSGKEVPRFNGFERANHWATATSFIIVSLTGLILLYGQYFLKPWLGAGAYGSLASWSAFIHMGFMVPFVLGVLVMFAMWVHQNIINGRDLKWLAKGGGFVSDSVEDVPPQGRFNAGQKMIFWLVVLGMLALLGSGLALMFPFFWLGYDGMQWAQTAHAAVGLLMVALIIGHIYIGTVGMVGAFWAMGTGRVDRNWAEEHHEMWYRKLQQQGRTPESPAPAE